MRMQRDLWRLERTLRADLAGTDPRALADLLADSA
jgi:hypothetical protein